MDPIIPQTVGSGFSELNAASQTTTNSQVKKPGCEQYERHRNENERTALYIAFGISFLFMIIEVIGGIVSHSLAIESDALHMLTDVLSFAIAIGVTFSTQWPKTERFPYGYHRIEVLGCVASVLLTWCLASYLCYEALIRFWMNDVEVNSVPMFIVSVIGLGGNLVVLSTLHRYSVKHGHSHSGSVLHSHSHNHNHNHSHTPHLLPTTQDIAALSPAYHESLPLNHHSASDTQMSLNMHAARLHIISDLLQSVAVILSSTVIFFVPSAQIVDPICTFLFCVLTLLSTKSVARDLYYILMQATHSEEANLRLYLLQHIPEIVSIDRFVLWSINKEKHVATVCLTVQYTEHASKSTLPDDQLSSQDEGVGRVSNKVENTLREQSILTKNVQRLLLEYGIGIEEVTVQVEWIYSAHTGCSNTL